MKNKPEIIDIDAANRPSAFSIQRDGETITLTNGEVYEATKAQLHRMTDEALHYYAKVFLTNCSDEKLKLLEDNIVRSLVEEMTRRTLRLAYKGISKSHAPFC